MRVHGSTIIRVAAAAIWSNLTPEYKHAPRDDSRHLPNAVLPKCGRRKDLTRVACDRAKAAVAGHFKLLLPILGAGWRADHDPETAFRFRGQRTGHTFLVETRVSEMISQSRERTQCRASLA